MTDVTTDDALAAPREGRRRRFSQLRGRVKLVLGVMVGGPADVPIPVSFKHLTLPTRDQVEISEVAVSFKNTQDMLYSQRNKQKLT